MPETTPPTAGGATPQQAPMGVSPITGPTPNKGFEAAAIQRLGSVVTQLTDLLPLVGATSEIGSAVMKAINSLAKHVPPGASTPASEDNNLNRMQMQNTQNRQMQQKMRGMPPVGDAPQPGGPPLVPGAGGGMGAAA